MRGVPAVLARPRSTRTPLFDLSLAGLFSAAAVLLVAVLCALAAGGPVAAAAGLLGGAPFVASVLASLAIGACAERPWRPGARPRDPATGLLVGYGAKCLVGVAVLVVLRIPADWPRGWAVGCAAGAAVAMLVGEILAVRRMRIPYFDPAPSEDARAPR